MILSRLENDFNNGAQMREDRRLETTITLPVNLQYRVYLPADYAVHAADGYPLLLFLHGAGERGENLDRMAATGVPKHIENGELELPFVTICPQCPADEWWNEHALLKLLDQAMQAYNIDPARVYATGLSMGGKGTWLLADLAPQRFAAIAPICPPYTFIDFGSLSSMGIWVFHGVMDQVIPVEESARMVRMLRHFGCEVNFTTYPDADHDSWTQTYTNPELYEWLLSHRLGER